MAFATRVALLLAVIFMTAGAARPGDLGSFLQHMREQSGSVWSAHLISTSRAMLNGQDTDLRSESQDLRFSSYQCSADLCVGTYFDGERLHSININGTTLPQSDANDPLLRAERTVASLVFLDPAFTARGGSITDLGSTTISGTRYRELSVTNGDASPMNVFVDPKSFTVRYVRDVNGDSTFEYLDYRSVVGGLHLPFVVLRNGELLERYMTRTTTTDAFTAPHGPIPTFSHDTAAVPTEPSRAIPVFPCTLGEIATTCLLDSGNSGLSISLELAQRLHAPSVGSFHVRGLGDYATDVVRTGTLEVGNATFPAANYVVLRDIHRFGYDVVLGADVLATTTVALDPLDHRISFEAKTPNSGTSVPLEFQNFIPIVMVQLGSIGTQLALDTGDETNINLDYDFYQTHRDLFAATEQRAVSGVGGSSVELLGTIPEVRIGNLSMSAQPIGATRTLRGTAFGHLGAQFLQHFNVVIDYASGLVHFVPTPSPDP